jgi:uroporphyrinogen decarboxylase
LVSLDRGVQGNLEPALLLGPWTRVEHQTRAILTFGVNRPGHIFNLGHGLLPSTPLDNVLRLVDFVQERSASMRRSPAFAGVSRDAAD